VRMLSLKGYSYRIKREPRRADGTPVEGQALFHSP
jgi:hypothetical protein